MPGERYMKFLLKILLFFSLIDTNLYAEEITKCNLSKTDLLKNSNILLLEDVLKKTENSKLSELNCNTSIWSANKLSSDECKEILGEIEKGNLYSAIVPELLSAIDIVQAECGVGKDPKVVVKDFIPFMIEGTNLYFEWDADDKLVMKLKKNRSANDDYFFEFSQKSLREGEFKIPKVLLDFIPKSSEELTTNSLERKSNVSKWWDAAKNEVLKIAQEGSTDLYIPMIAYHDRDSYSLENIKKLNEAAIGFGIGKSITNKNRNSEMLFAMIHLDSHSQVEAELGYGWLKNFNVIDKTKVGVGYAAGLISREDLANRIPLPFILPMANISYDDKFSLNGVLIPKLDGGVNHGNVLFIFGKYTWEKTSAKQD
jgi:palmitoyl transferase